MKMKEIIKKYSEICLNAIEIAEKTKLPEYKFDKIVVLGMGGSAAGGYLLKDLLGSTIPIEVSSRYKLPKYINKNTLIFCVSYSGNTEETLSQFVDAVEKNCKIIAITSNGKLKEWCEKLKTPHIEIPTGYLPREAFPYLFFPMIIYLQKLQIVNIRKDIGETIDILKKIRLEEFDSLAESLNNSIVVIYGSDEFLGVAKRIKNQLNENAKTLAKYELFPELNHNEIVGYQTGKLDKNLFVIFLRDKNEREEMRVRIEITKELIRNNVKGIGEIWAFGESKLAKILSLVYVGDYLSYRLAELKGVNPDETEYIDILKKELGKKLNVVGMLEKRIKKFF
jgi:glucose/mannose-6-phosphate isomerase